MSFGEGFFLIGSLKIYYYGICMAFAVLCGVLVSDFIRKRYYSEITENAFYDTVFVAIVFGFIGARGYYCLVNLPYYLSEPLQVFNFRQGGLSIHGALILGVLAGMIFAKYKNYVVLKLADICSFGLIFAQALGRWGNYFNSEAFGRPTDIFCKIYIKPEFRPSEYLQYEYFHPTFLYESIANIIIFLLLFFVFRKLFENHNGLIFMSYLILYSLGRFFVELLRIDSPVYLFGLPLPAVVSLIIIAVGFVLAVFLYKFNGKTR